MSESSKLASLEAQLERPARMAQSSTDATAGTQPQRPICASGSSIIPKPASAGIDADDHALVSFQAIAALGHCVISTARTGALPET